MDSRYLQSLITTIEHGSIAEAARVENLTAAAISQRIQALERELGFPLLSRQGHAARPTEACLYLLPRARNIVREIGLLAGDADTNGLTGTIKIGAISTAMTDMLPAVLRHLTMHAPNLKPGIVPGTSRSLYQAVLDEEIDAAILVAPAFELPKSLTVYRIKTENLVLLSRHMPQDDIQSTLQSKPYLRYDPTAWGGRYAEKYLKDQGLKLQAMCDLDALETIAMLVADDVGVSLIPHWSGLEKLARHCALTNIPHPVYARELVLLRKTLHSRPAMLNLLAQSLEIKS
ncbi:MAG: LysR family transcriptional regulator [Burkholderiales bacterium]|nr:LysR family transcriptional regulator [Burkholderiales bacterium]MBI3728966.1 LysR family transcriptional regulator [Burkholderiales bacterium]